VAPGEEVSGLEDEYRQEVSGLEDEYRLSGDRPKLIYIRAPAPNRQPRLTEMIPEGEDRRIMALAQLLQAIARGTGSDHGRWRDPVTEASRRLEAEGEPLAVSFGLVAGAVHARIHGRMDEARLLAQQAHDISTRMGDSYVRVYASTQLARAALGLGDVVAARSSAVEALLVARRLRNPSQMGYALELWATAELRDGRIERAGQLYALAERGTRLVSDRVWPTDARTSNWTGSCVPLSATGTSRRSPRRAPSTWIGQLPSSSSPIRWPSGCPTAVMHQLEPRNRPGYDRLSRDSERRRSSCSSG
jgi:hypothetical protein